MIFQDWVLDPEFCMFLAILWKSSSFANNPISTKQSWLNNSPFSSLCTKFRMDFDKLNVECWLDLKLELISANGAQVTWKNIAHYKSYPEINNSLFFPRLSLNDALDRKLFDSQYFRLLVGCERKRRERGLKNFDGWQIMKSSYPLSTVLSSSLHVGCCCCCCINGHDEVFYFIISLVMGAYE